MTEQRPSLTRLLLEAIRRLFADEAIPLAGNIAFRFLFSIFPFLIFLTALAGFFGSAELAARIVTYLLSVAPKEFVTPIAPEINSLLTHPRTGLLSVSAAITVWSAMGGVDSVRVALNRAYGLTEDRNPFLLYAIMALFVVGSAILLLALAVLIVLAPTAIHFISTYAPGFDDVIVIFDRYRYPLAIIILVIGLFLAHLILPARRVKIYYLMPGVFLTVAVWLVLTSVYSYFLSNFATFASTYAGLSGLFAAMFLIYLSALALILGGELNRVIVLARKYRQPSAEAADLSKE
ncbi:YihY/virulence factor BrkB family protein [Taklimakanibacter deserti]|uniref:YihY/virulence factor BrkB family protein n=1 Tax=Taklimakanibacter deserti TaxID=2267839 RepID=UPI000E65008A